MIIFSTIVFIIWTALWVFVGIFGLHLVAPLSGLIAGALTIAIIGFCLIFILYGCTIYLIYLWSVKKDRQLRNKISKLKKTVSNNIKTTKKNIQDNIDKQWWVLEDDDQNNLD